VLAKGTSSRTTAPKWQKTCPFIQIATTCKRWQKRPLRTLLPTLWLHQI
jgi:hypothetical protein